MDLYEKEWLYINFLILAKVAAILLQVHLKGSGLVSIPFKTEKKNKTLRKISFQNIYLAVSGRVM